tara:strand:+ start:93 stop:335 length:243 start_codon:yes stop_codon:yes gene_type:complete
MIDKDSESGSWRRDWDSRHHTMPELQQRINELKQEVKIAYDDRDRCRVAMLNVMALVRGKVENNRYMPDQIFETLEEAMK